MASLAEEAFPNGGSSSKPRVNGRLQFAKEMIENPTGALED
jgi:hypothetical protein